MKKTVFIIVVAVGSLFDIAKGGVRQSLPDAEVCELRAFFKDFVVAFNANDVECVKRLSGRTWESWAHRIGGKMKFESIEIVDVQVDTATNVIARVTTNGSGCSQAEDAVFTMEKVDGNYIISRADSCSNIEAYKANDVFDEMIKSIQRKDLEGVKKTLTFGTAEDFDSELSTRGLSWIKDAVEQGVNIPGGWGVRRESDMSLTGHVEVPSAPGGTNILREVRFKGLKIDRAAPRKETKEEFLKRFRAERAASRKRFEEQQAALVKQLKERATEQLCKQKARNGAGTK